MIDLDHHATSPCPAAVVDAMAPWWSARAANAGSPHDRGAIAAAAVATAAEQLADYLGAAPDGVVWTSGATESDNLALAAVRARPDRPRVVIVATEHPAVSRAARALDGVEVVVVPVDAEGAVDPRVLARVLAEAPTALVSAMAVNHEVGALHPLADLAAIAHGHGAWFHTDAAQSGFVPLRLAEWGVDLASVSAHKIGGPMGVGALWSRPGLPLVPLLHGGGNEVRPGTLPVPLLVGFAAAAAQRAEGLRTGLAERVRGLRDALWSALAPVGGVTLRGPPLHRRAPHNLNVGFAGVDARALVLDVADRLSVSTGATCSAGLPKPSAVLTALGVPADEATTSVRFGLGPATTEADVIAGAAIVGQAVARQRARG